MTQRIGFKEIIHFANKNASVAICCDRIGTPEEIASPLTGIDIQIQIDFENKKIPFSFEPGESSTIVNVIPEACDVTNAPEIATCYFSMSKHLESKVTPIYGRSQLFIYILDAQSINALPDAILNPIIITDPPDPPSPIVITDENNPSPDIIVNPSNIDEPPTGPGVVV